MDFWKQHSLDGKLSAFAPYRKRLNRQLSDLLNLQPAHLGQSAGSTDTEIDHQGWQTHSNIVEVLTINRAAPSGLQNTAALLTLQNGTTVTLAPQGSSNKYFGHDAGNRVIRYRLDEDGSSSTTSYPGSDALIENAPDFTQSILQSLYFREEDDRRVEVKDAHAKTFEWIFRPASDASPSAFRNWLLEGQRCFWINGKAGSGKSTLMKYVHQHASLRTLLECWASQKQLVVCSFFFWHSGTQLQKSYEGILRSILHQILGSRPDLTPLIFPRLTRYLLLRKDVNDFKISEAELQAAVELLAKNMPSKLALFLLIDGIDEYVGDHFDFSRFLVRVSESSSIKILVSSRPIPACHQVFSRFPNIRLQDLTFKDIESYINHELVQDELFHEMDYLEPGFADDVTQKLVRKASGVFLWIVLVVKKLLIGLGNFDDRDRLMATIDELPGDLEALYSHMFSAMSRQHQREGSLLLQLLVHAHESQGPLLSATQFFIMDKHLQGIDTKRLPAYRVTRLSATNANVHAAVEVGPMMAADGDAEIKSQVRAEIKAVEGKLRSRCWGLIEVQYTAHGGFLAEPKVDFLHRTVHDYVQDPDVRRRLNDLYTSTPSQLDLAMLSAWTFKLKRQVISCTPRDVMNVITSLVECLVYCRRLNDGNSAVQDYELFLEQADSNFRKFCLAAEAEVNQILDRFRSPDEREFVECGFGKTIQLVRRPYQKVCECLCDRPGTPGTLQELTHHSDLATSSTSTMMRCGLFSYVQRNVGFRASDSAGGSEILLYCLHSIIFGRLKRGESASCYFIILYLLKFDADANCPLPILLENSNLKDDGSGVFSASPSRLPKTTTPWEFWLTSCTSETPFVDEISNELIRAGANLMAQCQSHASGLLRLERILEEFEKPSSLDAKREVLRWLREPDRGCIPFAPNSDPSQESLLKRKYSDGDRQNTKYRHRSQSGSD